MLLRLSILSILFIGFAGIALALYYLLKKYGSLKNIIKADKLAADTFWIPVGKSPFECDTPVRIIDMKDDFIKFETVPGSFTSLPLKQFLSTFKYTKDSSYNFPNVNDLWEEISTNPFEEKQLATVTGVKKGWVSYDLQDGGKQQTSINDFVKKYQFKDFNTGYTNKLESLLPHQSSQHTESISPDSIENSTHKDTAD